MENCEVTDEVIKRITIKLFYREKTRHFSFTYFIPNNVLKFD